MTALLPTPKVDSISSFSPSLVNDLVRCSYRAAFRRDARFRGLVRPNTFSALGMVVHELAERVWKGELNRLADDAVAGALAEMWAEAVQRQLASLGEAWSPAVVPEPLAWPGYQLTRARSLRRLQRAIGDRRRGCRAPEGDEAPRGGGPRRRGTVENPLRDPSSGLEGQPDRLERTNRGTRIVDVKSGLHQGAMRDDQRRQLLLYACLVHAEEGEWPVEICIEDTSGEQDCEPLESDAAQAALDEAVRWVQVLNAALSAGDTLESLATPSAEICRWCPYRPVCRPYWEALDGTWSYHGSVLGAAGDAPRAHDVAVLSAAFPRHLAGSMVRVLGAAAAPPAGGTMSVVDADPTQRPDELRARWTTTFHVLSESAAPTS